MHPYRLNGAMSAHGGQRLALGVRRSTQAAVGAAAVPRGTVSYAWFVVIGLVAGVVTVCPAAARVFIPDAGPGGAQQRASWPDSCAL